MIVKIKKEDYDRIVAHAKEVAPEEACGLLGGVEYEEDGLQVREIKDLRILENSEHAEEHFTMTPQEQLKVIKEFRSEGLTLLGNWHSHPVSPSRPSEEDKRLSFDSKLTYMILSLMDEDQPRLRAFHVQDKKDVSVEALEFI